VQLGDHLKTQGVWRMGTEKHLLFFKGFGCKIFVAWIDASRHLAEGFKRQILSPHLCVDLAMLSASPVSSFGSQTWKNLLNSLPLIVHWLAWKPGAGDSIIVGKDEILGMGKDSILTAELITCLNSKNVYFLFQAS
jgi:hypothetical protein